MSTIHKFEEIEAWQTARALTRAVYSVSSGGPFAKDFGLRDQMRRAAVSIQGFVMHWRTSYVRRFRRSGAVVANRV